MLNDYHNAEELKRLVAFWFAVADHQKIQPGHVKQLDMFIGEAQKLSFAAGVLRASSELSKARTPAQAHYIIAHFLICVHNTLVRHPVFVTFRVADTLMDELGASLAPANARTALKSLSAAMATHLESNVVKCLAQYWI